LKTSSAKSKGRRASAEIKELLLKHCQALTDGDIVVTPSGVTGPDLHLSPFASAHYPLKIEAKNVEKLNIWAAIRQCEAHDGEGEPVLFFKRNRTKLKMKASLWGAVSGSVSLIIFALFKWFSE